MSRTVPIMIPGKTPTTNEMLLTSAKRRRDDREPLCGRFARHPENSSIYFQIL